MKRRTKVIIGIIIALAIGIGASSCGEWNDERGKGDAPVQDKAGDDRAAVVINMPDGFANVAIKCYAGNGLYVTTRDAPPIIIADDPNCDGNNVNLQAS